MVLDTQANWAPLNDLGAEGWELISVDFSPDEEGIGVAVFKRELKEFRPKLAAPSGIFKDEEVSEAKKEVALTEDGEPVKAREGLEEMKRKFAGK